MIQALLPVVAPIVSDVLGRVLGPNQDKKAEIERELNLALLTNSHAIEQAAAQVVVAEAKSEHFITATWRPILMLVITAIVGWNYLVSKLLELAIQMWTGDVIPLGIDLPEQLWQLLMIGCGGYILGRSGEKIATSLSKPS